MAIPATNAVVTDGLRSLRMVADSSPAALVARGRPASPGPHTDGKRKRRHSPEQLDHRVDVGASVVDPRSVEDRHDENADSHAECETGNEVRDDHTPGGRRAEQRIQGGEPGGARRACQRQHDDVQVHSYSRDGRADVRRGLSTRTSASGAISPT